MKIEIIEPYFTGSHALWAEEYQRVSRHEVKLLSLSGRFWKWRMHGGAITLAQRFNRNSYRPDLLLATSMLDLTTFLALTRHSSAGIKTAVYLHENQLTYPWSPKDRDVINKRDMHYGFINYASVLAADRVLFNSQYHRASFLEELPRFLKSYPDYNHLANVETIIEKSQVLYLGMDLKRFEPHASKAGTKQGKGKPLILWNHRWEYDKNPEQFFKALFILQSKGLDFEAALLGECFARESPVFLQAREMLGEKIIQFGYVDAFEDYASWLWRADLLPVTSMHDFFGGSVVQALYCNCYPLLPKRLAYPEHIPENCHDRFFYDGFDDLVARLEKLILNIDQVRQENIQPFVSRYDWQTMAPIYDDLFEAMV